jgi:uncharacterized membrane protein
MFQLKLLSLYRGLLYTVKAVAAVSSETSVTTHRVTTRKTAVICTEIAHASDSHTK